MKGPNDKRTIRFDERSKKGVLIGLAVHHVNRFDSIIEPLLDDVDGPKPPGRFAETLIRGPLLRADRFLQTEDGLECHYTERYSIFVGGHSQRNVSEKALGRGFDQSPKPTPLRLPRKFELTRVMGHDDAWHLRRPTTRLSNMRCKDRLVGDLVVAEEAIGSLELSVIKRLRKAFGRTLGETLRQQREASV